jgi:hypothetical protein
MTVSHLDTVRKLQEGTYEFNYVNSDGVRSFRQVTLKGHDDIQQTHAHLVKCFDLHAQEVRAFNVNRISDLQEVV